MQIRGEAAIACGFMASLATGLLFDGCFDGYINRFRDSGFSKGKPWKAAPARREVAMPIEPFSLDVSKIKVIVTKNGKIYHRAGCKNLSQNAIRTRCHWRPRSNEARRPAQYVVHQRPR